jgi:uncharacterized membrane protein YraQ (UPF0718 family)
MASLVVAATGLGFGLGQAALPTLGLEGLAIFQALVAGSLLHVVFAHPPTELEKSDRATRGSGGAGALAGVGLTAYVALDHPVVQHCSEEQAAGSTLLQLAFEFSPAIVLALVLVGLMSARPRTEQHLHLQGGNAWSRPLRGLSSGLPLPISSCGILPVYRSLVEDRVPASAALAFLIATPQLGLAALLVSWPAFGPELTTLRVVVAVVATLSISASLSKVFNGSAASLETSDDHAGHHHPRASDPTPPLSVRLREGLRFGLSDLADHLLPWLAVGFVLAALAEALLPEFHGGPLPLPTYLQVLAAALIGLPLYLCATGSTPLLAILLHKGLSPGSALAFLVTGPSLNIETFALVRELHGTRRAWFLATATCSVAIILGLGVDLALGAGLLAFVPGLAHSGAEPTPVQQLSLGILIGLAVLSLLRSGARGWLGQLQARYGEHVHSSVASHRCDHDHGHAHAHAHD